MCNKELITIIGENSNSVLRILCDVGMNPVAPLLKYASLYNPRGLEQVLSIMDWQYWQPLPITTWDLAPHAWFVLMREI